MYRTKVDEKNRVVIATKKDMNQDLYDSLSKRNIDPIHIGHVIDNIITLPDTLTAKARCHEVDVFDANIGVEIAKDRFKVKYKAVCAKKIDQAIAKLKFYIEELEKFKKRYED